MHWGSVHSGNSNRGRRSGAMTKKGTINGLYDGMNQSEKFTYSVRYLRYENHANLNQ